MSVRGASDLQVSRDVRQGIQVYLSRRSGIPRGIDQKPDGILPWLVAPVCCPIDSWIVHEAADRLLQMLLIDLRRFPPSVKSPRAKYHVRSVGNGPRCLLTYSPVPAIDVTGTVRQTEIVEPPFVNRW